MNKVEIIQQYILDIEQFLKTTTKGDAKGVEDTLNILYSAIKLAGTESELMEQFGDKLTFFHIVLTFMTDANNEKLFIIDRFLERLRVMRYAFYDSPHKTELRHHITSMGDILIKLVNSDKDMYKQRGAVLKEALKATHATMSEFVQFGKKRS